jgi:hypothetical protein
MRSRGPWSTAPDAGVISEEVGRTHLLRATEQIATTLAEAAPASLSALTASGLVVPAGLNRRPLCPERTSRPAVGPGGQPATPRRRSGPDPGSRQRGASVRGVGMGNRHQGSQGQRDLPAPAEVFVPEAIATSPPASSRSRCVTCREPRHCHHTTPTRSIVCSSHGLRANSCLCSPPTSPSTPTRSM